MMETLREINDFDKMLGVSRLVLVDFYATWCEPCKWLDVILQEVNSRFLSELTILRIDSEQFTSLSERFGVRSVPVLILFKEGVEVWRMNGFLLADELVEKIRSFDKL
jgi:thioredoxin 1